MKQVFTEFFVAVKQLQMGNDDNTAKWIYAGYATTCVTGIFALSIMTGTPFFITFGSWKAATGITALALGAPKPKMNTRNKSKQIYRKLQTLFNSINYIKTITHEMIY